MRKKAPTSQYLGGGREGNIQKLPSFHSVTTVETHDPSESQSQVPSLFPISPGGGSPDGIVGNESTGSGVNDRTSLHKQSYQEDDEDLPMRVWPIFSNRTVEGTVAVEDLLFIAKELGMECDDHTLLQVVPRHRRNGIYFEECVSLLKQAVQTSREDIFRHETGEELDGTKVRKVGPFQGLLYCLGCDSTEGAEPYEVDMGQCLNAKTLLLLCTLVVFISVAGAIIAFPANTWLKTSIDRSEAMLFDFQSLVKIFSELVEERISQAHEDSILDTATTFARITEYMWGRSVESSFQYLENEAAIMEHTLLTSINGESESRIVSVSSKIHALVNLAPHVTRTGTGSLTAVMVLNVLAQWNITGMMMFVNSTANGFDSQQRLTPDTDSGTISQSVLALETYCDYSVFSSATAGGTQNTTVTVPAVAGTSTTAAAYAYNVTIITAFIPETNVLVCFVSEQDQLLQTARTVAMESVQLMNAVERENVLGSSAKTEVTLWASASTSATSVASENTTYALTPLVQDDRRCRLTEGVDCTPFHAWISRILTETNYDEVSDLNHPFYILPNSPERFFSKKMSYYNGEVAMMTAKLIPKLRCVLLVAVVEKLMIRDYKDRVTYTVEVLNWAFLRTTEIVISDRDEASDRIIPQATSFRFNTTCFGVCNRFPESSQTALLAFRNGGEGGGFIIPDYRPEPVASMYGFIGDGLNLGLLIERDVQDLRGIVLKGLAEIVESINAASTLKREITMLRWSDYQVSRQFDSSAPCDENVFCLVRNDQDGIVFRGDCVHCVIRPPRPNENVTFNYVTELVHSQVCASGEEQNQCNGNVGLAMEALNMEAVHSNGDGETAGTKMLYTTDYANTPVVAMVSYVDKLSTGFLVTLEEETMRGPILVSISLSIASASALTAIGLIFVTLVTQRVLTNIEAEWQQYKARIDAEKEKFGHFIQFMIPKHLLSVQRSGQSVISEPNPTAHIIVVDVAGLSTMLQEFNARSLVRFLTYYQKLLDDLCVRYGLFKLKTYGDVFVGVTQLGKLGVDQFLKEVQPTPYEGTSAGQLHRYLQDPQNAPAAINVAAFAVLLLQLLSHEFQHTKWVGLPTKKKLHAQEMLYQGVECIQDDTLPLRIGIHTGPLVSGYVEMGRMPKYDCYGPGLALANRMQLTCPPSKIHVTTYYKDELENIDGKLFFDYEPPRKTIVRGRGTVVSYVLKSAYVPVPDDFIAKLGIVRAHKPLFLERGASHRSNRSGSSKYSGSSRGSIVSGYSAMDRSSSKNSSTDGGTQSQSNNSDWGAPSIGPPRGGASTQAGSINGGGSEMAL